MLPTQKPPQKGSGFKGRRGKQGICIKKKTTMDYQQILACKGYALNEIEAIVAHPGGLDEKCRAEHGVSGLPLHLWEGYYRGDADEASLQAAAAASGHESPEVLLAQMGKALLALCEEYPEKRVPLTAEVISVRPGSKDRVELLFQAEIDKEDAEVFTTEALGSHDIACDCIEQRDGGWLAVISGQFPTDSLIVGGVLVFYD
jgi:hypothetical protein